MAAIGTEPVSPHYESFGRSRKYPISKQINFNIKNREKQKIYFN